MTTFIDYNTIQSVQMMPDEIEYMVDVIKKQMPDDGVFVEWGSGGSTCLWLESLKESQSLISIEHNREWFDRVNQAVREPFKFDLLLRFSYIYEPEEAGYNHGYGGIEEENPFGLWRYMLPTEAVLDGDVFFIDGLARGPIVALLLLKRRKPNSFIFVHDYKPRTSAYYWISQLCDVEIVGSTLAKLTFKK